MADATDDGDRLEQAAEAIGHALGRVAGLLDATRRRTTDTIKRASGLKQSAGKAVAKATSRAAADMQRAGTRARSTPKAATKAAGKKRAARTPVTARPPAKTGTRAARRPAKTAAKAVKKTHAR